MLDIGSDHSYLVDKGLKAAKSKVHQCNADAILLGLGDAGEDAQYVELLKADFPMRRCGCLVVTLDGIAYVEPAGVIKSGLFRKNIDTQIFSRFWHKDQIVRAWSDPAEDTGYGYRLAWITHIELVGGESFRFFCNIFRPSPPAFESNIRYISDSQPWSDSEWLPAEARQDGLYASFTGTDSAYVIRCTESGVRHGTTAGKSLAAHAQDLEKQKLSPYEVHEEASFRAFGTDFLTYRFRDADWAVGQDNHWKEIESVPLGYYLILKFFPDNVLESVKCAPGTGFFSAPDRMPFLENGGVVLKGAGDI